MDKQVFTKLNTIFKEQFTTAPTDAFFSPGRINLIGEHTDYNGGHVFPAAITIGTYGVGAARTDKLVRLYSTNFPDTEIVEFDIDDTTKLPHGNWANFVKGDLIALRGYGNHFNHGFDLVIEGNIPSAAGLSSSSSLELMIGVVVQRLFQLKVPRLQLVAAGKQAENEYIGVNTGIMDQFAIGFGEANKAIYLDTNTMIYEMVPVELGDYVVVIMNTNKPRNLVDSKYNERVKETQEAVYCLQKELNINTLGELSSAEFEAAAHLITNPTVLKRARHAVTENERTQAAVKYLTAGNLVEFGKLLNASHQSLKDDYGVSGVELDTLAETAQQQPGVLGARMTGAGFGGCAIALVKRDQIKLFEANVSQVYTTKIGYAPSFYVADIGPGAHWVGLVSEVLI
ncbi:galactokinase [Periweissella fabalis]|uniref:Galactokinase n=1 Tax=Periweissella fabalis TaxID=1070421 RepID=A0A7X6S239_9LACO|nr:galactokinase [Periweissella fabalis]MCM0599291.1 galactokinase [Periweissella fabalis]NKZ23570.1 galactokinase [Periweissella fabalis]